MSLLDEITPSPRKVMTLFYLVDTSGSMSGEKIGTVNSAMEECIPMLKDVAKTNDDAEIKVAILQFSSGCQWVTPESGPVGLDDLVWNDIKAGGLTDFGLALKELDKKLSRKEFLQSQTGAYAPVILLLSDGGPTDNWQEGLDQIKQNNWFKHAIKIALNLCIDDTESDRDVLAAFTGNPEAIIDVHDTATLKKMIHKVSVRASEFQSHSKQSADETSAEEDSANIVKDTTEEIKNEETPIDSNDWGDWE